MICLSVLDRDSLLKSAIPITYSAYEEFANKYDAAKTDVNDPLVREQFTTDCTKFIVDKLIDKHLGGSILTFTNKEIVANEADLRSTFKSVVKDLVSDTADDLEIGTQGDVDAITESYMNNLYDEAVKSTVHKADISEDDIKNDDKPVEVTNALTAEDPVENADVPNVDVEKTEPVITFGSIVDRIIGDKHFKFKSDIVSHLQHVVSTIWVDGRVKQDGTVVGFMSKENVANDVRSALSSRIKTYFTSNATGTLTTQLDNKFTDYILLDKLPSWMSTESSENGITIATCNDFTRQWNPDGTYRNIKFVVAPSLMDAGTYIKSLAPDAKLTATSYGRQKYDLMPAINAPDTMSHDLLPVYYSYIISTGENFKAFMKQLYPVLSDAYSPKFRTGSMDEGTVSGLAQESASLNMHKQAALNIRKNPDGSFSIKDGEMYINPDAISLASDYINKIPHDLEGARSTLKSMINASTTSEPVKDVLESIYQRFFAPDDYKISNFVDPSTGEVISQTMRSYSAMVERDAHKVRTEEGYASNNNTTKSDLSKLDDVLSALMASMKSSMISNKVAEVNGNLRKTDIAGGGATLAAMNQNILASVLGNNSTSTSEFIVNNNTITAAEVRDEKGDIIPNSAIITIYKKPPKGSKEPMNAYMSYTVRLNKANEGETLAKKPISIIYRQDTNVGTDDIAIADLFRQFRLPSVLLASRNFDVIRSEVNADPILKSDMPLDELYLNMLFPIVLNGSNSEAQRVLARVGKVPETIGKSRADYDPLETIYGYKPALNSILERTDGIKVKKSMKGFDGETLSAFSLQTMLNRLSEYADQAAADVNSIHHDNVLVGPERIFKPGFSYIKQGLASGDNHKAVGNMTIKENLKFLVESAYLQTMAKSGNFKTTSIQPGAQADRQHPYLKEFTIEGNDFNYIELQKDSNGAPRSELNHDTYINLLSKVHAGYYTNVEKVLCEKWNKVLDAEAPNANGKPHTLSTASEIATAVDKAKIPAEVVQAEHGLQKMIFFGTKDVVSVNPVTKERTKKKLAIVPEDILQSIATFTYSEMKDGKKVYPYLNRYIEANRQAFRLQLEANDYSKLSEKTMQNIRKVTGLNIKNQEVAKNLLFDSYFYNSQILGVSALNLLTGGVEQFDLKKSQPLLSTREHFDPITKQLNTTKVLSSVKNLAVPGHDTTLEKTSIDDLLRTRKLAETDLFLKPDLAKINSLTMMKLMLDSGRPDEDIAHDLWAYDVTRHVDEKFVSQVKRNQTLGSAILMPRLANSAEHGFRLGENCNVVSVKDDEVRRNLLGVSGGEKADATDGVVWVHPLNVIKSNNSYGNKESNFMCNGVAMKNITIEIDENGVMRIQKKAEFSPFTQELLEMGSPALYQMLVKMNRAIDFTRPDMLVRNMGETKALIPITESSWMKHGLAYGDLYYTSNDGTVLRVNAKTLVGRIRSNSDMEAFRKELNEGKYYTDKVERNFKNLQDLYEYYGEYTNPTAWNEIAEILGTTHSLPTPDQRVDLDLKGLKYDNRNDFIEKIGLTSQEKTGSKNVIEWKNLVDPSYEFYNAERNNRPRYSSISNKHHGQMLQAEHEYDTTNARRKTPFEHHEKSEVSPVTQLLSAVAAEGQSSAQAAAISSALNMLASSALAQIRRGIVYKAVDQDKTVDQKALNDLLRGVKLPDGTPVEVKDKLQSTLNSACEDYARELVSSSLEKQEDPGLAAELLSEKFRTVLSFDQKQLLPLVQSQLYANTEKKAVRTKFAGGQFVVSPAHGMLTMYRFGGVDNLTRGDLNRMLYYPAKGVIDSTVVRPITTQEIPFILPTDLIIDNETGNIIQYIDAKKRIREVYGSAANEKARATTSFNEFVNQALTSRYSTRFNVEGDGSYADRGRDLNYTNWVRYNANGDAQSVFDTDEFKTYNTVAPLRDAKLSKTTAEKFFGIDDKHSASEVAQTIPEGLFKTYYFDVVDKENTIRTGVNKTTMLTPSEKAKFVSWLSEHISSDKTAGKLIRDMYDYIGTQAINDNTFIPKMRADLYDMLETDPTWTSKQAEVHMPYMHCDDFLIHDGTNGERPDRLFDLTRGAEEPNWDKPGVMIPGVITADEINDLKFNFIAADSRIGSKLLAADQGELYKAERDKAIVLYENLREFFSGRLQEEVNLEQNLRYSDNHYSNTFAFASKLRPTDPNVVINAKILADRTKNSFLPGSESYEKLSSLVNDLKKFAADKNSYNDVMNLIKYYRDKFVVDKAPVLAANFPKTLEFIMARIPGPSKQTAVSAKIRNFIFSTKNSVYGPVELLMTAGLDFDIDKQNVMTWSTEDGKIVNWKQFGIGTGISKAEQLSRLENTIDSSCATVAKSFDKNINAVTSRYNNAVEERSKYSPETDEYKDLSSRIIKLEHKLENLNEDKTRTLRTTEYKIRTRFARAIQNYIVHNLHTVTLDPKNAIEMSAVTSTAKVKDAAVMPGVDKTKIKSLTDVLVYGKMASQFNPYSVPFYENTTMAGRSGIGIYASDTKAYYAAYNASINATPEEQAHIKLKSDLYDVAIPEGFGVDKSKLQFFAKSNNDLKAVAWEPSKAFSAGTYVNADGVIYRAVTDIIPGTSLTNRAAWKPDLFSVSSSRIANAEKWTPENKQVSEDTKRAYTELTRSGITPEEEVAIVQKYVGGAEKLRAMNTGDQAWDMFSNLVNAATDNAKELILGKIGANNTTGSLISTMVRFGVDLKHIVQLINTPEIQDIVRQIELRSDLKTRQESEEEAAMQGKLYDEAYNRKLSQLLKDKVPLLPTNPTDAQVIDYLTNPIRQLYTHAKATLEFSTLSKMLSINQGLPNDAFSGYNFISSIESMLNASILEHNKHAKSNEDKMPLFSMEKFVSEFNKMNETGVDSTYITDIVNNFDKIRTGINVPFTMLKNELFMEYFNTFYQTKAIRDNLSSVNAICEQLIHNFGSDYVSEYMYKELSDSIYDIGVVEYLKKVAGKNNPLLLKGNRYDLSKPRRLKSESEATPGGRLELLVDMPKILSEIVGNDFVDSLRNDLVVSDPLTGISVTWLKGPDLMRIKTDKFVELKIGLTKLAQEDPALYNALFYYSLITTKGGYSGGSFSGLFPGEKYADFSKSIKNNSAQIRTIAMNNELLMKITNSKFLPQVRTINAPKGKASNLEYDDETGQSYEEMNYDNDDMQDIELSSSALSRRVSFTGSLRPEQFKLTSLNAEARKNGPKDYVRSKDNSLTYKWNDTLGSYVPLINTVPKIGIPLTLTSEIGTTKYVDLEQNGFEEGFRAKLPAKTDDYCNVLFYLSKDMLADMKASGTDTMKSLLDEKDTVTNPDVYVVKTAREGYTLISRDNLQKANTDLGYIFDEEKIVSGNQLMKDANPSKIYTKSLGMRTENGTSIYSSNVNNGVRTDVQYKSEMYGGDTAVYDRDFIKKVLNKVTVADPLDNENANVRYKNLVEQLAQYRVMKKVPNARYNPNSDAFKTALSYVENVIPGDTKLDQIMSLSRPLEDLAASVGVDVPQSQADRLKQYLIPAGILDKTIVDAISDVNKIESLPINTVSKIIEKIRPDEHKKLMNEYANIIMSDPRYSNNDLLSMGDKDGTVYVSKSSKAAVQKNSNDTVLSKPLRVPAGMKHEYSREVTPHVLFAICSHLNKTFPGVTWRVMRSAEILKEFGPEFPKNKGFVNKNGTIVINSDRATIETPFHEFGHIYLQHLRIQNPEEYAELMKAAMLHPLFKSVSDAYTMLDDTSKAEETVAELLSMRATDVLVNSNDEVHNDIFSHLDSATTVDGEVIKAIKVWLSKLFNNKSVLGLSLSTNDSLATTINKLADDMVYGKNSVLEHFTQETRDKIRKLSNSHELPLAEARQLLIDRGYMQWYCV